jgi:hypothetical protein
METTVISDAVNTASRMEGLTSIYGGNIIVSQNIMDELSSPDKYEMRYLGTVKAKGKEASIAVYEILTGLPDAEKALKLEINDRFQMAITHYRNQEFSDTKKIIYELMVVNPADLALHFYKERCEYFIVNGVPDDWKPIERMTIKKLE